MRKGGPPEAAPGGQPHGGGCHLARGDSARLPWTPTARAGPDIATVAAITGHSPEVMLRHYWGVTEDDKRRAAEVACLGEIPEGRVVAFRGLAGAMRKP